MCASWKDFTKFVMLAGISVGTAYPLSAGGSVPSQQVLQLTKKERSLDRALQSELRRQNLKEDALSCTSEVRVGRHVTDKEGRNRGGETLGPYTCNVGSKSLTVRQVPMPGRARARARTKIEWDLK